MFRSFAIAFVGDSKDFGLGNWDVGLSYRWNEGMSNDLKNVDRNGS